MNRARRRLRLMRQRSYWQTDAVMIPAMDMPPEAVFLRRTKARFASDQDAIEITSVHRDWTTVTTVLSKDVVAVFIPKNAKKPESGIDKPSRWLFAGNVDAFTRLVQKNHPTNGIVVGRVYVQRNARVLMNVELGMTAGESAEYFPEQLYMSGQHGYGDCRPQDTDGPCKTSYRGDC